MIQKMKDLYHKIFLLNLMKVQQFTTYMYCSPFSRLPGQEQVDMRLLELLQP